MITIHSLESTKKIYLGTEFNLRKINQVALKIELKVTIVKVVYTITFHRLLRSILNVFLPRKTKTIQK